MHEYALTSSIVDTITNSDEIKGAKLITKVVLGFGPFSHATPDRIQFWWEALSEDTIANGSTLIFEELEGSLYCPNCKKSSIIKNRDMIHADEGLEIFACPNCQSLQTQIESGTEIVILRIEIIEN
jgi:hydrogenase nickel incorporation protein HypA/HybF